ncbi:hypothetical protein [Burkholderia sp. Ac-20365]|uniref:hypothetical protein n=1 Tax=Burkholderia sp. Ac-20365 TaxID=2703897 RepID=UPI00197BDA16|nr:hypothetical protein [Burkholderia sp. Ac-20365]MBN3760978.1 hypothetical protein [Burkholderia sp. Ac-20365]
MNWGIVVKSLERVDSAKVMPEAPAPVVATKPKKAAKSAAVCATVVTAHAKLSEVRTVSLAEPDDLDDDVVVVEASSQIEIDRSDSAETILAKSMWNLMGNDLRASFQCVALEESSGDLFGPFTAPDANQTRLYDCLAWIYSFQRPRRTEVIDGKVVKDVCVTIEWVANQLGCDVHALRRRLGRVMRPHLKGLLRTVAKITSPGFVRDCEMKLAEYVDVTGWRVQ